MFGVIVRYVKDNQPIEETYKSINECVKKYNVPYLGLLSIIYHLPLRNEGKIKCKFPENTTFELYDRKLLVHGVNIPWICEICNKKIRSGSHKFHMVSMRHIKNMEKLELSKLNTVNLN